MAIQIKLKNSVVQDSTPSASDLPVVGELALNANINSIGGFMRASDNSIVKIFGPGSVTTPTATTTVSGISELATNTETTTGTATNRVVTPAGLNAVTVAERTTSNTNYVAKAGSTLTGVLTMPNGSNSAPAINFGDTDSGIYGGTNIVSLTAGGTQGLSVNGTDVRIPTKLGINGATPSTPLDVIADASGYAMAIRGRSADDLAQVRFASNDYSTIFAELESDATYLATRIGGSEKLRVDSSGRLLIGTSSSRAAGPTQKQLQIEGTNGASSSLSLIRNQSSTDDAVLYFAKTRHATVGGSTIVQDDDKLGDISFAGADGTDIASVAARIQAFVDGTPGSNDMPGRLVFSTTADGAASPSERLRIANNGNIFVNKGNATGNATIILDKSETGAAKLEFDKIGSQKAYIELDASENLVRYGVAGVNHIFYSGTERMRLDDSGRLGIGTTSPTAKLHVVETTSTAAVKIKSGTSTNQNTHITLFNDNDVPLNLGVFGSSAGAAGAIGANTPFMSSNSSAGLAIAANHASGFLKFGTGSSQTERMRIDSSGNVGIGETSPANLLHVKLSDAGIAPHGSAQIVLERSGTNYLQFLTSTTGTSGLLFGDTDDVDVAKIVYDHNVTSMQFVTETEERMRIASDGKVGIGSTSPEATLHEKITTAKTNSVEHMLILEHLSSGTTTTGFGTGIRFRGERNNGVMQNIGDIEFEADVNSGSNISCALVFKPGVAGIVTEKMRLTSDGLLGIGTTAPEGKGLDVTVSRTNGYAATSDTRNLANIICRNSSDAAGRFAALSFINGGGTQAEGSINLVQTGNYNGDLAFKLRTDVSNWAERLRITSAGNVGIGTASPTSLLNVHGIFETNAFDSSSGSGGRFTTKGFLIGDAYTAGKTSSDDRNSILWNERGLDIDVATNDTIRMKVHSGGGLIVGAVMTKDTGTYYDDITINNGNTASGAAGGAGLSLVTGASSFGGIIFSTNSSHGRGYMKYDQSNDRLILGTQTIDRIMIEDSGNNGDVHIKTGNIVFDTVSKGIDFSATGDGAGSQAHEVLDDYEEGTWTPQFVYWNGSAWVSVAFSNTPATTNAAYYTKIGNMVHWSYYSENFLVTTGAGSYAAIQGLPYTNNGGWSAFAVSHADGFGEDTENGAHESGSIRLRFFTEDGITSSTWSSSLGHIMASGSYRTNT